MSFTLIPRQQSCLGKKQSYSWNLDPPCLKIVMVFCPMRLTERYLISGENVTENMPDPSSIGMFIRVLKIKNFRVNCCLPPIGGNSIRRQNEQLCMLNVEASTS